MKQKSFSFLLALLMSMAANVANAYDAEIDGIYYNFSGDEATVTYKAGYNSYSGTVTIPETVTYNSRAYNVTGIGELAFCSCWSLSSVIIPKSITTIGERVFRGCSSNLESIVLREGNPVYDSRNDCNAIIETATNTLIAGCEATVIPNSVTSIGTYAFSAYDGLTSFTIPESVTSIGDHAFADCYYLTSITIPESVTSISSTAFRNCRSIESIVVEEGNTIYDSRNDCNAVIETASNTLIVGSNNTIIPEGVTSIGDYAFSGRRYLTSITIPKDVKSIGTQAFINCSRLSSITFPNSLNSIMGPDNFAGTAWYVNQPDGLVYAGKVAYKYKGTMPENTTIDIQDGTLGIASWVFSNCSGLTSITIPNSVTNIGGYAFYNCTNLTSITIPNSVTNIDGLAFDFCSSLTSVIVDRATPLTLTSNPFFNHWNATLYVPYGSKSAYEAADYWKDFNEIVEMPSVIIGSTGYATYCSAYDLDFSEVSGLKAYIASGFSPSTGKLVLTRVTEVPAGEGLYIVGDEGRYNIPATTTDMFYSNLLKGVTTATTIYPTDGSYTNFILANGSHGVAFYSLSEAGELAAGKAYLQLPTASVSEVKAIRVIFDDDEDAVLNIEEESQTQRIYNLQGQQVHAPKSGLYIINGKKVVIK